MPFPFRLRSRIQHDATHRDRRPRHRQQPRARAWRARAASGRDRDHRPGHRLDGVFPAGVETINLEPDAGQLAGWLRTRYPDEIDTLRVTTRTTPMRAPPRGSPTPAGPDARHVAHAVSKSNQKALLAAHGIPAAQFVTGTLARRRRAAAADPLRFPVVVKPSEGSASDGVRAATSPRSVRSRRPRRRASRRASARDRARRDRGIPERQHCVEYFDGR